MLPDFLVVGAAKAGTTSLYYYLLSHPDIYISSVKEPHFFAFMDKTPDFTGPYDADINEKGIITKLDDYEKLFNGVSAEKAIGECSNSYLYFPEAVINIKKYIPDCKIIIILRNPIDRTYSHYRQAYALGHDILSFEDALEAEEERLRLGWRWHYQYRKQGLYYKQVNNFIDNFGRDNVKIYTFDFMINSRAQMITDMYSYLGVSSDFDGYPMTIYNKTTLPRSWLIQRIIQKNNLIRRIMKVFIPKPLRGMIVESVEKINKGKVYNPEMNKNTREKLVAYFETDILQLQNLIDTDLSMWLNVDGV